MASGIRLTYEYVKDFFEENGCKMLDTKYKNARTHINYECSCGNVSEIIFDSFRRGHRCMKCGTALAVKDQTFTFDYVYNYFKDQGCELLEKEYINAQTKMKYRCGCGDISFIHLNNFKNGRRCSECGIKKRSGKNHYEWIDDKESF